MTDKGSPELVEKVAREIYKALGIEKILPWDTALEVRRANMMPGRYSTKQRECLKIARAALAATPLVKLREALEEANSALQAFRGIQRGNGWDDQLDQLDEAQTTIRAALSSNLEGG